jgi:Flp pilus assembly protein TadD
MSDESTAGHNQLVDTALADPAARRRLIELIARELPDAAPKTNWQRWRPFIAGLSSGSVVLLAFLIPSLQDQWDRYRMRVAVDRYVEIGRNLMRSGQYDSAEGAFNRAVELSGNQRLDLIEDQTRARVMRIYDDPQWRGEVEEDIREADFVYLLALESSPADAKNRAATLTAYGAFLAGQDRWKEAEEVLTEAITLQPGSADPHIHLGNLFDDVGKKAEAEREYRRAIVLDDKEPNAHYNLGLLLAESGRHTQAAEEFKAALTLRPEDGDTRVSLIEALQAAGRLDEARDVAEAGLHIDPSREEYRKALDKLNAEPATESSSAHPGTDRSPHP